MALNEISMALTSFKTVAEILKAILKTSKDIEVKEKVIDLQNVILSLQSEYSELLNVKSQLEKKLMEYENWDKTASQYELKEVTSGVFVYAPKKDSKFAKPEHWLCTNCFDDRKKSILQLRTRPPDLDFHVCPKCDFKTFVPYK